MDAKSTRRRRIPVARVRIGEAAAHLGVSTHLLRHWEAEGIVVPRRTTSGARRYDSQHIDALAIAIRCQQAGMSLSTIAQLLNSEGHARRKLVTVHRDTLTGHREQIDRAVSFLDNEHAGRVDD